MNQVVFPPLATTFLDQLNKAIGEEPNEQTTQREKKIKFTSDHINQVTHVNGKRVYYPIVNGEDIHFFIVNPQSWIKTGESSGRTHYYPIQYAEITFQS